ncbi:MAG: hypothetical protein WC107_01745 [Patescibacteria group bacterium]
MAPEISQEDNQPENSLTPVQPAPAVSEDTQTQPPPPVQQPETIPSSNPEPATESDPIDWTKKIRPILVAIILLVALVAAGYYVYKSFVVQEKGSNSNENTNISATLPKINYTVGANVDDPTLSTLSTENYTVSYPKTWQVSSSTAAVSIKSPQSTNSASLGTESDQNADVLISSLAYKEASFPDGTNDLPATQSHLNQVLSFALQIDQNAKPISAGSLQGFAAVSSANNVSYLNVILADNSNIILLKFEDTDSVETLSIDQKKVLDEFKPQK